MNGGDDENRTRDLCRDSTDGTAGHWKYVVDNVIVYRDVYRAHSFNESHGIESLYAFMDSNGCRGRFELTTFGL
jgi:hypothetical protein